MGHKAATITPQFNCHFPFFLFVSFRFWKTREHKQGKAKIRTFNCLPNTHTHTKWMFVTGQKGKQGPSKRSSILFRLAEFRFRIGWARSNRYSAKVMVKPWDTFVCVSLSLTEVISCRSAHLLHCHLCGDWYLIDIVLGLGPARPALPEVVNQTHTPLVPRPSRVLLFIGTIVDVTLNGVARTITNRFCACE